MSYNQYCPCNADKPLYASLCGGYFSYTLDISYLLPFPTGLPPDINEPHIEHNLIDAPVCFSFAILAENNGFPVAFNNIGFFSAKDANYMFIQHLLFSSVSQNS